MSTGHRFARHSTAEIQQGLSAQPSLHPPRILVLYGSLRPESYSRKAAHQAVAILEEFGAEVRVFEPAGLPIFDYESVDHPKVQELRGHVRWAEGMVWCSPEIHGTVSAAFKNQIDWIPLTEGSIRPTQGKTLAVMQVTGGSQSFNVVNTLRVLGRWMRMLTIPNQSSIPKAWQEFDQDGTMKPSSYRDRVVDVMEELVKFTILTRDRTDYLVDRFSESQDSPPLPPAVPVNKDMALPLPQAPTRACCT